MAFHKAKALQEAEKSVAAGKITQAIRLYQEILNNDPSDVSLLNTVGDLYIRDRNIAEGLKQFHKLAEAYTRDGFNVKAIAIYRKISKVDPHTVDTLLKLAELYQLQGLSREAREQYLQATEFFKKRNQPDRALDVLRKIVQLDPANINYRNRLATECEQMGKREDAAQAHLEAAEISLRHNDHVTAEASLKKAADLNPKNVKIQMLRAKVAIAHQQPEEAANIIASSPELLAQPEAKRILLDAYIAARNLPEAERLVLEVFHSNPVEFGPVANVSDQLVENGQAEEAYNLISSVAGTLVSQNNAAHLMPPLKHIWSALPNHIPTMELMHQVCERSADEATLPEVLEALGHAYEQTGDLEKAEASFLKLTEREPENETYHGLLNAIQRKLGREIKPVDFSSREMALTAVEEPPAKPAAPDANQEAMVKEALENSDLFSRYNLTDKAIAELEKVLQVYPDQVDIHQRILEIARKGFPERGMAAAAQLARIFAARGDHETAGKYEAIASAKGQLHEIPLPTPPTRKVEPPAEPPPPEVSVPATPDAGAVMEFPLGALQTEEPPTVESAPLAEPVAFNFGPVVTASEPPPAPPLSPPPAANDEMELDLSEDLDSIGLEVPAPPEPEPVVASEIPPPLEIVPPQESAGPQEVAPPIEVAGPVEVTPTQELELLELEIVAPLESPVPAEEPVAAPVEAVATSAETMAQPAVPFEQQTAGPDEETVKLPEPVWVDESAPVDLIDSKIEIEFYVENGFADEARKSIAALEERYPESPLVAELRRLVDEKVGLVPQAAPAPVESAHVEPASAETAPAEPVVDDTVEVISPVDTSPAESRTEPPPAWAEEPPQLERESVEIAELSDAVQSSEEEVVILEPEEAPAAEPAQEEWELPTSYAGPHPETARESESFPPEPGTVPAMAEPAVESPPAAGMDMLGDLAGDFESAMDGMVAPEEPAIGIPTATASGGLPESSQGAEQLSGLLAEIDDSDAEAAAAKEDPETHYNLGVAFREMGLLDESIGEFQKVVKGAGKGHYPTNFLQACSLLAICFMEKKMPTIAAKWYLRALETPNLDDEATLALEYDLGIAYEQAGDSRRALERFTEVYSQNIDFRDVAEKIRELQQKA